MLLQSLAREILVWSKMQHPNILPLLGFSFDETRLASAWIVTPWQQNGGVLRYIDSAKLDDVGKLKLARLDLMSKGDLLVVN